MILFSLICLDLRSWTNSPKSSSVGVWMFLKALEMIQDQEAGSLIISPDITLSLMSMIEGLVLAEETRS